MADKNIFDIYGGLDTRESYGNESSILSYTEAKNIDIDGKVVRRARGQTQVSIAPSGSTWAGIAPAPNGFIGGINEDGKYYRTDPVTLISTPVYSGIINMPLVTPTNLSGVYNEDDNTISLTWTNENGTDVDIEIWLKIDSGEYTLIETGLSNWLGGDIPTGVTHDVSALGYGTFYYKVRATNGRSYSDYSDETNVSVTIPIPSSFALSNYDYNSDTNLYDWSFSWNYPITATSFKLYRKTVAGSYSLVKTIDGSLREDIYNFTPSAGNTYIFKMTAIVDGVETGASNEVVKVITSDDIRLTAVANVSFSSGYTHLTWTNKTGNNGYDIFWSRDGSNWTLLGTAAKDATSYPIPAATDDQWYHFKVRANNNVKGILSADAMYTLNISSGYISPFTDTSLGSGSWRLNMGTGYSYTTKPGTKIEVQIQYYGEDWQQYALIDLVPGTTSYTAILNVQPNRRVEHIRARLVNSVSSSTWYNRERGYDYPRAGVISAPTFVSANRDPISPSHVILEWQFLVNYPYSTGFWLKPNPGDNWIGYVSQVVKCNDSGLATARLFWESDNAYAGCTYGEEATVLEYYITI